MTSSPDSTDNTSESSEWTMPDGSQWTIKECDEFAQFLHERIADKLFAFTEATGLMVSELRFSLDEEVQAYDIESHFLPFPAEDNKDNQ
jgi:hypothetical protein